MVEAYQLNSGESNRKRAGKEVGLGRYMDLGFSG